jgi:hypothetical protein
MRLRAFVVQSPVGPSSRITSTSSAVVKLPWTLARKLGPTGGRLIRHAPVLHPPAGRQPLDAAPLWADPLDRAARGASDLIPESCTGSGGNEQREGAAAAVSLHDTVGVTALGGNGVHRPQGFPEWLPLTCSDGLTSWPARWTPSPGRRSVHIGNPFNRVPWNDNATGGWY